MRFDGFAIGSHGVERHAHLPKLFTLLDHGAPLDPTTAALEREQVNTGIERDGLAVELRRHRLTIDADLDVDQIFVSPSRAEDDGGGALVDGSDPFRAITLHRRGATRPTAGNELCARLDELALTLQLLCALCGPHAGRDGIFVCRGGPGERDPRGGHADPRDVRGAPQPHKQCSLYSF